MDEDERRRLEQLEQQFAPQDVQAEEAVLGAALLAGEDMVGELVDVGLTPADFYRQSYGTIFEAMIDLHRRGGRVDHLLLQDELRRTEQLEQIGGPAALEVLTGGTPVLGNALDYARVVRRLALLRRRRDAAMMVYNDPDSQDRWAEFVQIAEAPSDSLDDDRREYDLRELMRLADTEPPWRCHGLAADGHVTTLVGRGGEGKSMVTLALPAAVQRGNAIAGIGCKRGSVVIFDAENGPWVMGSRIAKAETPIDNLRIFNAEGRDLRRNRAWFTLRAEGAGLVIFDSIRTLAPGAKENDSDDMAPIMAAIQHVARNTGAAVIAIHHRGKGEGDYRGSSAIRDQTDLMFVLERDEKDPEKWRRALRCVKCRIDEEPETRWIGIRQAKGEIYFTEAAPFEPESDPTRPVRTELEEQIAQIIADQGPLTRPAIARELGRDPKDQSVRRALQELLEEEKVLQVNGYRYVHAIAGVTERLTPLDTADTPAPPEGVSARARVRGADTLTPPDGEVS